DDVRGRLGRARAHPGHAVGSRLRARGDRLTDRPARGGGDHAAPRRAAAPGQHHRGRGLFNDVTALVAYRVAVAAVVAGSFSLADAGLRFVLGAAGGVAVGLAVG